MNAKEILALRKKLKMTQTQFAQALDTSPWTVSRWENKIFNPSPAYVRALLRLKREADYIDC